jgi:hypothetical protein
MIVLENVAIMRLLIRDSRGTEREVAGLNLKWQNNPIIENTQRIVS